MDSGRSSLQHIYKLRALDLDIARGLQNCSRIKWVEEGESSCAFFLRLVKKNSVDRNITALKADDGSVILDQDGSSRLLCSFYADPFSASPHDPVALATLLSNVSARLSPAESLVCRVLSVWGSVLLPFRVWLVAGPLAVMAFPWNSIFVSGLFLAMIWFLFSTLPLPLD